MQLCQIAKPMLTPLSSVVKNIDTLKSFDTKKPYPDTILCCQSIDTTVHARPRHARPRARTRQVTRRRSNYCINSDRETELQQLDSLMLLHNGQCSCRWARPASAN